MSNPTPNNTAMLEILAGLVESIVSTMPAEVKKSFDELRAKTSAAMTGKKDESTAAEAPVPDAVAIKRDNTPCDCPTCTLKEAILGMQTLDTKKIAFDLHVAGRIPMEIAQQVGGITYGVKTKEESERVMAALLLSSAKGIEVKTTDAQILQQQAIEHITKGILALNGLRATTA